jgi:hypothetical protein
MPTATYQILQSNARFFCIITLTEEGQDARTEKGMRLWMSDG